MSLLSKAQAEAVYSAMCALNNVCFRTCDIRFGNAIVTSDINGTIRVIGTALVDDEGFADQAAFVDAYGLSDGVAA